MYRQSNWDVPDPGSQNSPIRTHITLRCTGCPATFHDGEPTYLARAVAHHQATGHDISVRGVVQKWIRQQ
jgi:hypothetical protein